MKIGILTQPLKNNYGGILQNYALQNILLNFGHEVETIDWDIPNNLRRILSETKQYLVCKLNGKKNIYKPTKEELAIIRKNTNHFINSYIIKTQPQKSYKDFLNQSIKAKYEGYVVGSDQCWRPLYNYFLPAMFLNFVQGENVKRVAYAASFGTEKWEYTPKMETICRHLIKKFNFVSVREDSGVQLCHKHLGIEACQVLDPTMLLDKEDYIYLIKKENEPKTTGNLFNYILDPTTEKINFINSIAERMGLSPFQVLPKYQEENRTKENIKNNIEDCIFPKVTTWLRAFMDAEMTIVDSFHGMVFSIIFNKPFWVIGNKERGLSRFTSLLKLFNLEERIINVNEHDSINYNKEIDWIKVNIILNELKCKSKELLFKSLN